MTPGPLVHDAVRRLAPRRAAQPRPWCPPTPRGSYAVDTRAERRDRGRAVGGPPARLRRARVGRRRLRAADRDAGDADGRRGRRLVGLRRPGLRLRLRGDGFPGGETCSGLSLKVRVDVKGLYALKIVSYLSGAASDAFYMEKAIWGDAQLLCS